MCVCARHSDKSTSIDNFVYIQKHKVKEEYDNVSTGNVS